MNYWSERVILGVIAFTCSMMLGVSVYAYEPTAKDINLTRTLTNRLMDALAKKKRSPDESKRIETRLIKLATTSDPSLAYIFSTSHDYLLSLRTELADGAYFKNIHLFLDTYGKDVQTPWDNGNAFDRCFAQYAVVDDYSRQIQVPTAFILATWFIESSCSMENPANRDGVFQIVPNDYAPGVITIPDFLAQLKDFGVFVQRKWTWYNSKQPVPINLSHNTFSLNILQTFGALYNGFDGDFTAYPLDMGNPYYFYANYNADYTSKRDGWLVTFMKILRREAMQFGK